MSTSKHITLSLFWLFIEQNPLLSGYIQQSPTVTPQYRPAGFYPQQFPLYYPAVPSGSLYSPQPVPYQSVYPAGPNPYYQAPFYSGAPTYSSGQRASVNTTQLNLTVNVWASSSIISDWIDFSTSTVLIIILTGYFYMNY